MAANMKCWFRMLLELQKNNFNKNENLMNKVEIYNYYSFGYNYYILLNGSKDDQVHIFYTKIAEYLEFVDSLKLKVTKSSLNLQGIKEDINKLTKLNKGRSKNSIVPSEIHDSIIKKIINTDKTLDAELNTISAYYLQNDKRISQEILENDIRKLFANDVFYSLPDIASFDFDEAGKCILFNRYTACAFHTLRGTEDTLKFYYQKLLNEVALENQTWYNFHNEIEKSITNGKITPKPSEELMINLNSLRKFYRNKTQHPQMIYNSDDVQDLLFLCIKTVNEMIQDLEKRKLIDFFPF